jgi:hypothetical protein
MCTQRKKQKKIEEGKGKEANSIYKKNPDG